MVVNSNSNDQAFQAVGQIRKGLWLSEAATVQRTRATGPCTHDKGDQGPPAILRAGCGSGGQLTKVWLIGAPLELDSSGAGLDQEMSHQLVGHVPWDEKRGG